MISFKQFILKEDHNFKGWTSPSGDVHMFDHTDEHSENHHPDYLKDHPQKPPKGFPDNDWFSRQISRAQKHGYVRFGRARDSIHGRQAYIHYDSKHPRGHTAALHTLRHMNLHHNEPVSISDNRGGIYSREVKRQMNHNHQMTAAEAGRHLAQKVAGITESFYASN